MSVLDRDEIARLLEAATPGPWRFKKSRLADGDIGILAEPGACLAECFSSIRKIGEHATDEQAANAALIALAPALARAYVTAPTGAAVPDDTTALAVEAMRNRLIDALASIEVKYVRSEERGSALVAAECLDAVLTVAMPTPADLLAVALALPEVRAMIEAAVAAERDRCAKIADDMPLNYPNGAPPAYVAATWDIAAAIRGDKS